MKISIIIPTLNEEEVIDKTLRQIYDNLNTIDHEIIITDSGSTDRTIDIAKKYGRVVSDTSPKRTIASNRNNGARYASGDYLVFIDADIFIPEPSHFFRMLIEDFAADPKLLGATVKIGILPDVANTLDRTIMTFANRLQWFNNNVIHTGGASGEFQMIKRSAFETIHGYKEYLAMMEDNDLFIRLSKIGRTHIDMRLTAYNTGRRPHAIGWPKMIWEWAINYWSVRLFDKAYSKKWNRIG